jgi:hypothetical protein
MNYAAILIALVLAYVAWKFVAGLAKFAVLAIIVAVLLYVFSQGGLG